MVEEGPGNMGRARAVQDPDEVWLDGNKPGTLGRCGATGHNQLLRGPLIAGGAGHGQMHDPAGVQFDDHEDVDWPEQPVINDAEITSPDVTGMVLQAG